MNIYARLSMHSNNHRTVALVDSSLTLLNPPYVGYQRNFVGWIKRSESTKKLISREKNAAGLNLKYPAEFLFS